MFIPDPELDFLPIPDPGVKKAPDPGSITLLYTGIKWVSNKWIREGAQIWKRPCRPDQ
jgi:hypothetical protein